MLRPTFLHFYFPGLDIWTVPENKKVNFLDFRCGGACVCMCVCVQAKGIAAELRPLAHSAEPDSCRIVTWLALSAAEELMLGPGSGAGPPCRPIGVPVPGMYENIHCGHGLPAYLFRQGHASQNNKIRTAPLSPRGRCGLLLFFSAGSP